MFSDLVLMWVYLTPALSDHRETHRSGHWQTPATDGLGSWSSEARGRALHVNIHLQLPRAHAGSNVPLEVEELHTALHQYDHILSTPPSVYFKTLNLSTVLAWIESEVCDLCPWHPVNLEVILPLVLSRYLATSYRSNRYITTFAGRTTSHGN